MVEGGVNTATYRIEGSKHKFVATDAKWLFHLFLASMTSFCRLTQGDCVYQYFVGTTGVTFGSEGTVVEVMEVGKSRRKM